MTHRAVLSAFAALWLAGACATAPRGPAPPAPRPEASAPVPAAAPPLVPARPVPPPEPAVEARLPAAPEPALAAAPPEPEPTRAQEPVPAAAPAVEPEPEQELTSPLPPPEPPPPPADPVAQARLLASQGQFALALDALGEARGADALGLEALLLEWLDRPAEAVRSYARGADQAAGPQAEAFRARARVLVGALDRGPLAALAADCPPCPEGGWARARLAELAAAEGGLAEAVTLLEGVAADFPGAPLGAEAGARATELRALRDVRPGLYGLLLPLSGPLKPFGSRALRGALLASGLLAPGADPGLRLAVADSQGDPAAAAAAAVRDLARQGVVGIVGPLKGSVAAEAARAAREAGVPLVTLTPAEGVAGDGVFRLYLREEDEVQSLVEHAVDARAMKRFAILYPDTPLGRRYRDLFWAAALRRGAEITGVEALPPEGRQAGEAIQRMTGVYGLTAEEVRQRFLEEERERLRRERDLGAALGGAEAAPLPDPPVDPQRLAKYKPRPAVDFDAVFLPVGGLEAAQLAPLFPYHDVGGVTLLGTRAWNYPTLVDVGREYVEGALFPAETAPGSAAGAELAAAYRRVYGEAPGALEAYAFDAVRLLARAHAALGGDTRLGLRRRLEAVTGADGATGPIRALATGDLAASAKILTVRRGRVEPAR